MKLIIIFQNIVFTYFFRFLTKTSVLLIFLRFWTKISISLTFFDQNFYLRFSRFVLVFFLKITQYLPEYNEWLDFGLLGKIHRFYFVDVEPIIIGFEVTVAGRSLIIQKIEVRFCDKERRNKIEVNPRDQILAQKPHDAVFRRVGNFFPKIFLHIFLKPLKVRLKCRKSESIRVFFN